MKYPRTTREGKCRNCGSDSMTLAVDQTAYTPYKFDDDDWRDSGSHTEQMSSDDPRGSVRFFCADCGTQHQVPKELT